MAAILFAVLLPTVLIGMAAIAVDIGMLYREADRVQRAADAAALSAVTWMPGNLGQATTTARRIAAVNGYAAGGGTTVEVDEGDVSSQLRVTITTTVDNTFGAAIGSPTAQVTRTALADYTAPAPMGSPCNTFGNEPPSTAGAAQPSGTALPAAPFPNCSSNPQFWAAVEGPGTDKVQGDRYGTMPCSTAENCVPGRNSEYRPEGYFFALRVEPAAVGRSLAVQVYDPAYVETGVACGDIDQRYVADRMSDYTPTAGAARYADATSIYCSGDYNPRASSDPVGQPLDTTFLVRQPNATGDPLKSEVVSGCTQQFEGRRTQVASEELRQWTQPTGSKTRYAGFNPELARVFHQWVELCSFTPTMAGNYYLQVRTNRSPGGTAVTNSNESGRSFDPVVWRDNASAGSRDGNVSTTTGLNSFALRVVPSRADLRDDVAVAGYSRMPVLQNAPSSRARFNLIRALPSARGQYIAFDFFDAADGSTGTGGSVRVIAPPDATGSIRSGPGGSVPGCRGALGDAAYTNLGACTVPVKASTHNGKIQQMVIPLPEDYSCSPATLGGCWFQVETNFSGSNVTDFTTWDANIAGDPVRLIE